LTIHLIMEVYQKLSVNLNRVTEVFLETRRKLKPIVLCDCLEKANQTWDIGTEYVVEYEICKCYMGWNQLYDSGQIIKEIIGGSETITNL
jgi:hypothetical protein